MARIAILCDTHFGTRSDSSHFHENAKKSFRWFFEILDARNIKYIIHLGDLFDRRKYLNFATAKNCRETFLEPCQVRNIETYVISGNHDQFYRNTHEINALDEIIGDRYDTIFTYSVPTIITIGSLDIQLLPWITDSNRKESLDAITQSKADIAMGHLEVDGFEMYKGHVCNTGFNSSIFSRFDRVYTGHYHHRSSSNNIFYLGAFGEYTWSDYDDPRGFHILDTETREIEFIKNNNNMFHMVLYDDVKNPKPNIDFNKCKDVYVKIVCANRTDSYAFDAFIEKIDKAGPIDISIVEDINLIRDNMEDDDLNEAEDTPTIINKYIDGLTLPVDSSKMKAFMQEILKEAIVNDNI